MDKLIKFLTKHYISKEPIYIGFQIANCIIHTQHKITDLIIDDCCINITSGENDIFIPTATDVIYTGEEYIINNQLFISSY